MTLENTSIEINEEDGIYEICVTKNLNTVRPFTVQILDLLGQAERNLGKSSIILATIPTIYFVFNVSDYSFTSPLMLSIDPSSNRSCFTGAIVDDQIALEGVESVVFRLSLPLDGVSIDNDATRVDIIDNDGKYRTS